MLDNKKLALLAAATAWLATDVAFAGAGFGGRRLDHQVCAAPTCQVTVDYAKPLGGGNNCRVKVPDVLIVPGAVTSIEWTLAAPAGGGAPTHRFHADRVKFDDNDVSETTPSADPNFTDAPLQAQADRKTLAARAKRRAKVFTYTVSLEWNDGGTWRACAPLDPIAVNRGD